MYHNLLVAIDLSPAATRVLERIARLAAPDAAVHVLHIEDSRVSGGFGVATDLGRRVADIRARQDVFGQIKPRLQQAGIGPEHLEIRFGRPADEVLDIALRRDCDLILLGTHGAGGVRALLGSTANAVVRRARCDVYTVRIRD